MTTQDLWSGVIGMGSSIVIGVLAITGINRKIDKKMDQSAFKEFKDAQTTEHTDIKVDINKLFDKLEEIHKDMPKRNGASK